MVEMGAAANLETTEVHRPSVAANAARIRSRISAAARSVNVTATIRPGSTPRSRSSRYTSTSFRVFPVPALAHTTVFRSNVISGSVKSAQSPVFAIDAVLLFGGLRAQFAFTDFPDQKLDSRPDILKNRFINGVRDDRIFRRTKQQITSIDSDVFFGTKCVHRKIGVNRNLKRFLQQSGRRTGNGGIFEVVYPDGINPAARTTR